MDKFKDSFIVDLMLDKKMNESTGGVDLNIVNEKYNLCFQRALFQVMLIKIYFDEDPLAQSNNHLLIIGDDIRKKVIELTSEFVIEVDSLVSTNRSYYLMNFKEDFKEKLDSVFEKIIDYAVDKFRDHEGLKEFKIFIGLSSYSDQVDFGKLIGECEIALEHRIIVGCKKIIKFENVPKTWDNNVSLLNYDEERILSEFIENKDKDSIVEFIESLEEKINLEEETFKCGSNILAACEGLLEVFEEEMVRQGFSAKNNYGLIQSFNIGKKACCSISDIVSLVSILIENSLEIAGFDDLKEIDLTIINKANKS